MVARELDEVGLAEELAEQPAVHGVEADVARRRQEELLGGHLGARRLNCRSRYVRTMSESVE
jgi:hypothetical protein